MARPRKIDLWVAKADFAADVNGIPMMIHRGERVRTGHAVIRQCPDMFEPIDTHVHYDVEQTTAAPGELRGERTF
jgi:hypothetical protein